MIIFYSVYGVNMHFYYYQTRKETLLFPDAMMQPSIHPCVQVNCKNLQRTVKFRFATSRKLSTLPRVSAS
jgi:hypothetical protein